jgi:hypothetical protein
MVGYKKDRWSLFFNRVGYISQGYIITRMIALA